MVPRGGPAAAGGEEDGLTAAALHDKESVELRGGKGGG